MAALPEEQRMAIALVLIEGLQGSGTRYSDRHVDEPPGARARGIAGAVVNGARVEMR